MNSRHFLRRIIALATAACGLAAVALGAGPRNVLFVVVDDLNTDLGCYGHPVVQSPNIDRLAARGVRFDRAYSQYGLCNPSRVSFLSGRRPESTGVYSLRLKAREVMPEAVMLPQFFRQQGYFTAGAGKIHHHAKHGEVDSWDVYQDTPGNDPQENAALQARYGQGGRGGDGTPRGYPLDGDGSQTRDGLATSRIISHLETRARDGRPFFLAAGLYKPHLPWTAPRRFFDLYPPGSIAEPEFPPLRNVPAVALQTELTGFPEPPSMVGALTEYFACVSFTDDNLGQLIDTLDRTGLWENTVVVFFSDHGFHLGDQGGLWAKLTLFERGTRVPLIIAGAGVPTGRVVTHPVELIDIYPTLVDLAGFKAPAGLEGRSLQPDMQTDQPVRNTQAYSMVYHYDPETGTDMLGRSVRTGEFRYTEWDNPAGGRELYPANLPVEDSDNHAGLPDMVPWQQRGENLLSQHPSPKPGPAERPRALIRAELRID